MSKSVSLLSALLCTFIWGTTFIAQDTGMDDIGPFTFNSVRFFVGFLAIVPLVFLFELKNLKKCQFSRLTGSGSACFGVFLTKKSADLGLKKIRKRFPKFWCVVGKTI